MLPEKGRKDQACPVHLFPPDGSDRRGIPQHVAAVRFQHVEDGDRWRRLPPRRRRMVWRGRDARWESWNGPKLDLRKRRATVRCEGGAADTIVWRTAARLLPRQLGGAVPGRCS